MNEECKVAFEKKISEMDQFQRCMLSLPLRENFQTKGAGHSKAGELQYACYRTNRAYEWFQMGWDSK